MHTTRASAFRVTACALVIAMVLGESHVAAATTVLRLATTTSTQDSGLLSAILPMFEKRCGCRVDVVAVGTGQAIEIGRRGDADVLLVHNRKAEDQFVSDRHARERHDVMYNDFVIVGPAGDPAKVATVKTARDAFRLIAAAQAPFVSRGDKSGTHLVELGVWAMLSITPAGAWYRSVGQGMGETLVVAAEQRAYTLSDRATWLAIRGKMPALTQVLGGVSLADNPDPSLKNYYGVMAVNPETHPGVNGATATQFVTWLLSPETQKVIGAFGASKFGQPLFYPNATRRDPAPSTKNDR
jgi:tungstate transport system substrate-binding protein